MCVQGQDQGSFLFTNGLPEFVGKAVLSSLNYITPLSEYQHRGGPGLLEGQSQALVGCRLVSQDLQHFLISEIDDFCKNFQVSLSI